MLSRQTINLKVCIVLLCIVTAFFTGCSPTDNNVLVTTEAPENQEINTDKQDFSHILKITMQAGWRHLDIVDNIQIKNIRTDLEGAEYISQNHSNNGMAFIVGKFVMDDESSMPFEVDSEYLIIDSRKYKITDIPLAYNIITNHINSPQIIKEAFESAKEINFSARDENQVILLTEAQRKLLLLSIDESDMNLVTYPIIQAAPYPNYQFDIQIDDETKVVIVISKGNKISLDGSVWYETNGKLKDVANELLLIKTDHNSNNINSLFFSDQLMCTYKGYSSIDYTDRIEWFVRELKTDSQKNTINPSSDYEKSETIVLKFKKGNQENNVTIYKDGFIFNGDYYNRPNIFDVIYSVMNAS